MINFNRLIIKLNNDILYRTFTLNAKLNFIKYILKIILKN